MNQRGGHLSNKVTWPGRSPTQALLLQNGLSVKICVNESFCKQAVVGPTFGLIVMGSAGETEYH